VPGESRERNPPPLLDDAQAAQTQELGSPFFYRCMLGAADLCL
jgi:hypothetical protein